MGEDSSQPEAETAIRRAWEAGDMSSAVTAAIRQFGPEVYALLVCLHRDRHEADDVFSVFSERLWRSFPTFEWRCSVRTWCYLLARRSSHEFRRRKHRGGMPLSQVGEISQLAAQVRTETQLHLRTETKNRLAQLRDQLPEPDRVLLVLRLDRELPWAELARVFLASDAPTEAQLARESARLRKRFQLVKDRLLRQARQQGLFP